MVDRHGKKNRKSSRLYIMVSNPQSDMEETIDESG